MHSEINKDDAVSETSTTGFRANTPLSDPSVVDPETPWPGNTYKIFAKGTGRAITLSRNGLCLQDVGERRDIPNRWLCVETKNYFGFYNRESGTYMGHDDNGGMRASARNHNDWERMMPRAHPDGGYQLFTPHGWGGQSIAVVVAGDGKSIVTRPHGTTIWEFVAVKS